MELGETTLLEPIEIGGIPVPVEGTVDIDDPSGITITLLAPGQSDPSSPGVVATVEVGPDGTFVLPDIPSPGEYEMVISKPGFATETRRIVLQPGQGLDDVEISLRPGNGVISGTVSAPGASARRRHRRRHRRHQPCRDRVAHRRATSDPSHCVTSPFPVSTPSRSAPRTSPPRPERSHSRRRAEPTFDVQLIPSTGSVSGRALVNGAPARGLTVTITGGDINRTTAVVSQGAAAGTYSFFNLPAPRTYTLTFSGADTIPQVRVVDLDPLAGTQNQTGIDVSLSPERTTVRGVVEDVDGTPASQATVSLTDGADELTILTADEPTRGTIRVLEHRARRLHAHRQSHRHGPRRHPGQRVGHEPRAGPHRASRPAGEPVGSGRRPRRGRAPVHDEAVRGRPVPGDAEAITTTDATGAYSFGALDAPVNYVVAVFASPDASDPLDSEVIRTQPGANIALPDFVVAR